jgi:hypothetical protein
VNGVNLNLQAGVVLINTNFSPTPPLISDSTYASLFSTANGGPDSFNGYINEPFPHSGGMTNTITGNGSLNVSARSNALNTIVLDFSSGGFHLPFEFYGIYTLSNSLVLVGGRNIWTNNIDPTKWIAFNDPATTNAISLTSLFSDSGSIMAIWSVEATTNATVAVYIGGVDFDASYNSFQTGVFGGQFWDTDENGDLADGVMNPVAYSSGKQPVFIWLTRTNTVATYEFDNFNYSNTNLVLGIFDNGARNFSLKIKNTYWNHQIPSGDWDNFDGVYRGAYCWAAGNAQWELDYIKVNGWSDCFDTSNLGTSGAGNSYDDASTLVVRGKHWDASKANGAVIWGYGARNLTQAMFWNVDVMEGGTNSAIINVGGNGKWYETTLKLFNHSSNAPVIKIEGDDGGSSGTPFITGLATNQNWLTAQKVQDALGGGFYSYTGARTNTGSMEFNVNEWQEEAPVDDRVVVGWRINTGTHYFGGSTKPTSIYNGDGFRITNAIVTVKDLSLYASNQCFYMVGSVNSATNYLVLQNVTLTSAVGQYVINANTNGQRVVLDNCHINGPIGSVISTNISLVTTGANYFSAPVASSGFVALYNQFIPSNSIPAYVGTKTNWWVGCYNGFFAAICTNNGANTYTITQLAPLP